MTGTLSKQRSEELRRGWLATQDAATAAARLARVRELLGAYDSREEEDGKAWTDEHLPLYTDGDLVSRIEENIVRAAHVGGHELPIDPGTLAAWIAQLPMGTRTTVATMALRHITPALVHAHLLTLDVALKPALARAIARRVVLIVLNKRNASSSHGASFLRGPFWLHEDDGKAKKKPKAEARKPEPEQPKPKAPPELPPTSVLHGSLLFTITDSPDGPMREMCFSCGAEPSRAIKRRINVQPMQAGMDTTEMLVDFLVTAKELAKGAPAQTACSVCGATLRLLEAHEEPTQVEERVAPGEHIVKQREVLGRVRITRDLMFHLNGAFRTLEAGTECDRLRISGKEMFPPQGEEQVGVQWEGRLRLVPVSAVEVLEVAA